MGGFASFSVIINSNLSLIVKKQEKRVSKAEGYF